MKILGKNCSIEGNFIPFLCYDDKTLLQFFAQVSTTMTAGMVQELPGYTL